MTTTLFVSALLVAAFPGQGLVQPAADPAGIAPDLAPITRDQAQQRADSLFVQLDLNHDGIVTLGEAMQATAQLKAERRATGRDVAPGIGGHTARFMIRRFEHAEAITRPQFEQAMLDHFDQMDLNHDGVLSTAEREQAKVAKRAPQ